MMTLKALAASVMGVNAFEWLDDHTTEEEGDHILRFLRLQTTVRKMEVMDELVLQAKQKLAISQAKSIKRVENEKKKLHRVALTRAQVPKLMAKSTEEMVAKLKEIEDRGNCKTTRVETKMKYAKLQRCFLNLEGVAYKMMPGLKAPAIEGEDKRHTYTPEEFVLLLGPILEQFHNGELGELVPKPTVEDNLAALKTYRQGTMTKQMQDIVEGKRKQYEEIVAEVKSDKGRLDQLHALTKRKPTIKKTKPVKFTKYTHTRTQHTHTHTHTATHTQIYTYTHTQQ